MRRASSVALIAAILATVLTACSLAQDEPQPRRKVLVRVTPVYPELARRISLSGTIRISVTVAPNGDVKQLKALGGSPLLIQAAQDALWKWKWQTAPAESQELIEISFHP